MNGMTLLEFVNSRILHGAERADYQRVANERLPKGNYAKIYPEAALAASSEPVQTRARLEAEIASRLRIELSSGRWKISGRPVFGGDYREINPGNFLHLDFGLRGNVAGEIDQGHIISGYRDLSITTDDFTLLKWSTPEAKRKISGAIVDFLQNYDANDGPIMTCEALHRDCIRQLQKQTDIHPNSISFESFRHKFRKHVSEGRKHKNAPNK